VCFAADAYALTSCCACSGLGYAFGDSPASTKPWTVALLGTFVAPGQGLDLTGFLLGKGRCPYSKKCNVIATRDADVARRADVVVVFQADYEAITPLGMPRRRNDTVHRKPYRVFYWTEAVFTYIPIAYQRGYFDFEMGMHHFAPILNPFGPIYGPTSMTMGDLPYLKGTSFIPVEMRTGFAMSVVSHCEGTTSFRQEYIDALSAALGPGNVHQYGRCGNMDLPPKPIGAAAKVINTYKFYLAFENTIMGGYTTEKLYMPLMMNVIPVYYGALDAPNITKTPSYIRVSDFGSPKRLADYLLYLDAHPGEYMKYHAWRSDVSQFDDYYLDLMANRVPGPEEIKPYRRHSKRPPRSANACRLCDENLVERTMRERQRVVYNHMSTTAINNRFFAGRLKVSKKEGK